MYDEASPLTPEQQATPWTPLYRPPTFPMNDGLSDLKQFLMIYEATISSYGGNLVVMAKSFVMAIRSVAQTWYSSLWTRTITSWPKPKEMLLTSFQGFQSKPVIARPCSSALRSQMITFNHLFEGFSGFGLRRQQYKMTSSSKPWSRGSDQDQQHNTSQGSLYIPWRCCFIR